MAAFVSKRGCGVWFLLVACGSPTEFSDEHRTVTIVGGTCGEWEPESRDPNTITTVHAVCGNGMVCTGEIVVYASNGRYGRCVPPDSLSCDARIGEDVPSCSGGLGCIAGEGISGTGQCFLHCDVNDDCPDRYQTCSSGTCLLRTCERPDSQCGAGLRCAGGVCVHG